MIYCPLSLLHTKLPPLKTHKLYSGRFHIFSVVFLGVSFIMIHRPYNIPLCYQVPKVLRFFKVLRGSCQAINQRMKSPAVKGICQHVMFSFQCWIISWESWDWQCIWPLLTSWDFLSKAHWCISSFDMISLKNSLPLSAYFSGGELYSGTVSDFSGTDALIYRDPLRTEQYDLKVLNGKFSAMFI